MVRAFLLPFCCAWLLAPLSSVAAEDQGRPNGDGPPPWHIIGQDEQATSSRCIGRPETPLCAVETLLACFERARPDLCRMVDDDTEQYAAVFNAPPDPTKYLAYRIVVERSAAATSDTEIVIDQQEMTSGQSIGAVTGTSSAFMLRRQSDGRWKVVGWGDPEN